MKRTWLCQSRELNKVAVKNQVQTLQFLQEDPYEKVLFFSAFQLYVTYHERCDTFSMSSMVIGRRASCI
ncbi:MAG TPA: hypothetical protein DIC57_02590 [Sphaerochaeta sp.]|nr:hypothetical protein [Sphaerochaeta sp.]